jgi:hypothetical protein
MQIVPAAAATRERREDPTMEHHSLTSMNVRVADSEPHLDCPKGLRGWPTGGGFHLFAWALPRYPG